MPVFIWDCTAFLSFVPPAPQLQRLSHILSLFFSVQRLAEVQLPDITLSSLNALLQTVTYRLRKKRRGAEEGLWRQDRTDQLLVAFTDQSSVGQQDGKRGSVYV